MSLCRRILNLMLLGLLAAPNLYVRANLSHAGHGSPSGRDLVAFSQGWHQSTDLFGGGRDIAAAWGKGRGDGQYLLHRL